MKYVSSEWFDVVSPKAPSQGYTSLYRETKIVAHTSLKGRGKINNLRIQNVKWQRKTAM